MHETKKKYAICGLPTRNKLKDVITTKLTFFNKLPKLPSHYC